MGKFLRLSTGVPRSFEESGTAAPGGADTQIQYNSSGTLAGSSNFIWDYTNNRLGVGATPSFTFHSYNATNNTNFVSGDATVASYIARGSTDASAPDLFFRKARNTLASPTATQTNDVIGRLLFQAHGGSNYRTLAYMQGTINSYTSDTQIGSSLQFYTSPSNSVTAVERMRISQEGYLGIATPSPSFRLDVSDGGSSILIGADSSATTRTDATQKVMRFGVPHYTNAEEPVAALFVSNLSTTNQVLIGGGTGALNAATSIEFYTAANNTTVTGTKRMEINSSGNVGIGTNPSSNFKVKISADSGQQPLSLTHSVATSNAQILFEGAKTFQIGTGMASSGFANQLFFYDGTAAATRMIIDTSGNVGIGVTPSVRLHVSGSNVRQESAGADQGFEGYSSTTHIFSLTRTSNDTRLAAWGSLILKTNATTGPTSGTTALTIDTSQNVGIGVTPTSRNNTTLQIKDGIGFPATQVASTDANTLDDYEEGTWTPTIGGTATYTTQEGRYTKIGRLVFIECFLQINTLGTGSTTTISGLPFTVSNINARGMVVSLWGSLSTGYVYVAAYPVNNNTTVTFNAATAANTSLTNTVALFTNSSHVRFCGFYTV